MLKITALMILAAVIVLTGQYVNLRLKKRVTSLNRFIILIEGINSQISFSQKNIINIISDLAASDENNLKTVKELINMPQEDFTENWKKSIEAFSKYDCLNDEDKKILLSFGKILGVTDLQGQSNNCRLHIEMLKKQLQTAQKNIYEKSKMNTAISSFLAVAAIIIFY